MTTGELPFMGTDETALRLNIEKGAFNRESKSSWPMVDPALKGKAELKKFINQLLVSPKWRITAEVALKNEWIQKHVVESAKASLISASVTKNLAAFHRMQILKRAVLTYLATQASEKELDMARKTFMALDKNGDGRLSRSEITSGLAKFFVAKDLEKFLEKVDADKSGFVDYNGISNQREFVLEFCAAALGHRIIANRERLVRLFGHIDKVGFRLMRSWIEQGRVHHCDRTAQIAWRSPRRGRVNRLGPNDRGSRYQPRWLH